MLSQSPVAQVGLGGELHPARQAAESSPLNASLKIIEGYLL